MKQNQKNLKKNSGLGGFKIWSIDEWKFVKNTRAFKIIIITYNKELLIAQKQRELKF